MQTVFNIILLILFVIALVCGIYLIINWRHMVESDKERERQFLDWLKQVEEDLKKEKDDDC